MDNDLENSSGSDFDEDEDPDKIQVPGKSILTYTGSTLFLLVYILITIDFFIALRSTFLLLHRRRQGFGHRGRFP